MLLLNFIRALLIVVMCLVITALNHAGITGAGLAAIAVPILTLTLTVGDLVEGWLVQKFNPET